MARIADTSGTGSSNEQRAALLLEISRLRENFRANYRRPMSAEEADILDLAEKLLRLPQK
jgi:hypothetical protein